ncbi:hypothetical protein, partial [Nocardia neocaledoniensis]|uniref:hypothetical protein n=1 Tax=Nocardia neocaledoniensis TaxID=236511 RepID=UPI002457C382
RAGSTRAVIRAGCDASYPSGSGRRASTRVGRAAGGGAGGGGGGGGCGGLTRGGLGLAWHYRHRGLVVRGGGVA